MNLSDFRVLLVKYQLDFVSSFPEPQDSLEALEILPPNLDSAYRELLDRMERVKSKTTVIKVLSWVLLARRPLSIMELREAISIRPFRQTTFQPKFMIPGDTLVKLCQGLVIIDNEDLVRFSHYSVQEFLETSYKGNLLTDVDLAKICLTYLTFEDLALDPYNPWNIKSFGPYCLFSWDYTREGMLNMTKRSFVLSGNS
jgi:GPI inositol-deacylase, winged helix domain